jgi:hypothetical protein
MKFKNGWMAIAAFAASAMIFAAPTLATDYTFTGGGAGGWDDPDNWSPSGVPGDADCVYVPGNVAMTLDSDRTLGNLNVDGTFVIPTGTVLTLDGVSEDGDCTRGDHEINGCICLEGSGAKLRFIDADQIVFGSGSIKGRHNSARIEIEGGLKLTSKMTIEGNMVIDTYSSGTATFENYRDSSGQQGVVRANADGTRFDPKVLEFSATVILDDTHSGSYRPLYVVGGTGNYCCGDAQSGDDWSRMKFSREADGNPDPSLVGNFEIRDCGDLLIDQNIVTSGSLTFTSGTLIVATGKCFYVGLNTYCAGTYTAGSCP